MDDDQYPGQVNEFVQLFPDLFETLLPTFGRGERQWDEDQERAQANQDVSFLSQVFPDVRKVKPVVQTNEDQKMQACIKEGIQA